MSANIKFLARTEMFKGVDEKDLAKIGAIFQEKYYAEDSIVFLENDEGDDLYMLAEGTVKIEMKAPDGSLQGDSIELIGPGKIFGEFSFIDGDVRSASARVQEDSRILVLPRMHFDAVIKAKPAAAAIIMRNIAKILTTKIRKTTKKLRDTDDY